MITFETKIFANPAGIEKLKMRGDGTVFTQQLEDKRNIDGEGDSFNSGAYSIFYSTDTYIIAHHFDVTSEAKFRSPRTHIAVAIKRGYKLISPIEVFAELRTYFISLAATHKADGIRNAVMNESATIDAMVQKAIVRDERQPRICAGNKRAVLPYDIDQELNAVLENPNRLDWAEVGLMFVLPKQEVKIGWEQKFKGRYQLINLNHEEYAYMPKFTMVFPDNTTEIVFGENDEIIHTCSEAYCENKVFKGKLSEHWNEWKLSYSPDNTQIIVGVGLEPQKKDIHIICVDENGIEKREAFATMKFNMGIKDSSSSSIRLIGDEISKKLTASSESYLCEPLKETKDSLTYKVTQMYFYDFSDLLTQIKKQTGEDITLTVASSITKKAFAQFDKNYPSKRLSIPYGEARICIPETRLFQKTEIDMNPNGGLLPFNLKQKEYGRVVFYIEPKKLLKKPITCKYTLAGYPTKTEILNSERYTLEKLPYGDYEYEMSVEGRKPVIGSFNLSRRTKDYEEKVTFAETKTSKFLSILKKAVPYLICIIIGGGIGWGVTNKSVDQTATANKTIVDSLENVIKDWKDSVRNHKKVIFELEDRNLELEKQLEEAEKSKGTKPTQLGLRNNSEIDELGKKFSGISFTYTDTERAKELNMHKEGKYISVTTSAINCMKIIRAPRNKQNMDFVQQLISQLNDAHKKTIGEIVNGKYKSCYTSDKKSGPEYNSITDIQTAYDKKLQ